MCGVVGIYSPIKAALPEEVYLALHALQHRGQSAAGVAWIDGSGEVGSRRGAGLVHQALDQSELAQVDCQLAIGHVRYPTAGGTSLRNAQPLAVHSSSRGAFALAHNGNLTNGEELRQKLEAEGAIFQTRSDSEVLLHLITRHGGDSFGEALSASLCDLKGAYSYVIIRSGQLIGARDPWGVRPLCLGKRDEVWYLASESCAFDLLGVTFVRDIEPGEVVTIDERGLHSTYLPHRPKKRFRCAFEYVYFARPDSDIDGINVYESRVRMGAQLAAEHSTEATMVTGMPDSGTPAALGFARASGVDYQSAIVRNRYSGRTFIEPSPRARALGVRKKLNPLKSLTRDQHLAVVDDSVVRGTTGCKVCRLLREAGARGVHLLISSPPVKYPCFYGIDTPDRNELLAAYKSHEAMARELGVDDLSFLSKEGLAQAIGLPLDELCTACFDGGYMEDWDEL